MLKLLRDPFWLPYSTLALVFGGLAHLILSVLPRLKSQLLHSANAGAYSLSKAAIARSLLGILEPTDLIVGAMVALILVVSVVMEIRFHVFSEWLLAMDHGRRRRLATVLILSAFPTIAYMSSGVWTLGDSPQHITRVSLVSEMMRDGALSRWTFSQYGGTTLLRFYGPLFFWVAGLLSTLLQNPHLAAKLVLAISHLASGIAIMCWLRRNGVSGSAAVLASMVYTWSFMHLHVVLWAGALPLGVIYLLVPLLLERSDAVMDEASVPRVSGFAVVLALLLITHQGYAALTLQIWAFWVMIRSLLRTPRPTRSSLLWLSSGLGAGFGLAAFFLVPSIALADWAFLGSRPPILLPGVPTADLFRRLLIWNNTWSGWSAAYIGLTAIGIATWGVLRALRRGRRDEVLSLLTPLVLIGWILLCTATTERVIHLVLPFLALMVGLSLRQLGSRSRIGVVLLVVLAIDLGPTIIQAPFRTDLQARDHALAEFSKATYPHRVLLATSEAGKTNVMTWPNLGDPVLRTPNGGFPQGAPPGHLSAIALIDALNSPEIEFSRTTNLRALWDVTGLLLLNLGLDGEPVEMVAYQEPTPMIYSTRVETLDDPGMVWDLAISPQMLNEDDFRRREMMAATIAASETMRMDLEQLNAEVLFLAPNDDERVSSAGFNRNGRGVGSATVRSLSMDVGASQVRQRFSIPDPGWIRLPFSYSKFLRLSLDGEVVKPFEGAFGGTIIPVEAGVHDILIETKRLMIDQLAVAISLGLALTLIIANLRFRLD